MIKIKSIIPNFNLAFIIIYKSRVNYNKFKKIFFLKIHLLINLRILNVFKISLLIISYLIKKF